MNFNQAIRELQRLINDGQHGTPEHYRVLQIAQDVNPHNTPIGFYLDGPTPYTTPSGKPVRD